MRCLVTGGAGFIGAHLCRLLLERGHKVYVIDDLSGGFKDNVPAGAWTCFQSFTDPVAVRKLFEAFRPQWVFHLGAYAAEGLSHWIRRQNYEINLIGSANLINESVRHGVEHFVFASSMAVYGSQDPPFTEDMPLQPKDPYAVAKAAVEQDLAAAHALWGLPYTIIRPHNVYGPLQNLGDPYRNVVGIFMRQIMEGEPLTIFGDGEQTRAFSYVDDAVRIFADAPTTPKAAQQVFNVGSDEVVTINTIARDVRRAFEMHDHPVVHLPERHEVKDAFCDHAKTHAVFYRGLDVDFLFPVDVGILPGLLKMAAWAKTAGVRWSRWEPTVEIDRSLPEVWRKRQEKKG